MSDKSAIEHKIFRVPWMKSLAFQVPIIGLLLFSMLMMVTINSLFSFSEPAMEKQANALYVKAGERIASEIQLRSNFAETLARSLANIVEVAPKSNSFMLRVIPKVLAVDGNMGDLIAGGGFWPAPGLFTKGIEHKSFFWGANRDTVGKFDFYDDYNDAGYHLQEWYVLAKYLPSGGVYWSKSYADPYTGQQMVTVSSPVYRDDRFFGVVTIDVRLDSLNDALIENAKAFEGHAFVLDQIGRVISLPDVKYQKVHSEVLSGGLFSESAEYEFMHSQIEKVKQQRKSEIPVEIRAAVQRLALNITQDTDQVSKDEAYSLASRFYLQKNVELELLEDLPANEASDFSRKTDMHVFQLPVTNWHLVTLAPHSFKVGSYQHVLENILINQLALILLLALLASILTKYFLLIPLRHISDQLRQVGTNQGHHLISVDHKNEIGALAYWYNQRTKQNDLLMQSLQEQIEEKEEKETQLRRSRNRLRAIADTASDRIWEADKRGVYTFSSDSIRTLLGYEPEEVIGKTPFDFMSETEGVRVRNVLKESVRKRILFSNLENTYVHKGGSHVIFETSGVPIFDESGEFAGYIGTDRDITLRKSTERLERDKAAAELANKAKSEFLASMTHELRTPLHGILSFANMGIKNPDRLTREKTAEYLTCIRSSGDRLLLLINDLLDLSKFEAGRMELNVSHSSLMDVTQSCIAEQQARLVEMGLRILVKDKTVSNKGQFDAAKIAQTITNFLSNAIKFTPKDSVIEIKLSDAQLELDGQAGILFSMRDYGEGIPEKDLHLIFERFSQSSATKANATVISTGLGLAISKEIIEMHKGKIWAENHPDGGALFQFIIPLELPLKEAVVA